MSERTLEDRRMSDAGVAEPLWKRNAGYRALRRAKAMIRSHLLGARMQRRVERDGFRLVPERALESSFRNAVRLLQAEMPGDPLGDYVEFGVCHGASMACMHRVAHELELEHMRLIGFDSFEGLPPEADNPGEGTWRPGEFRSQISFTRRFLAKAGVDWSRTTLVKGWFRDTLTEDAYARLDLKKAGIIMVDCDIYSSARLALDFCRPLIGDAAVVLFDDWNAGGLAARNMGEKAAFDRFLRAHPEFSARELPSYTDNAKVFLLRREAPTCPR